MKWPFPLTIHTVVQFAAFCIIRLVIFCVINHPLSRVNCTFRSLSGGAGTPQFQNLSGAVRNASQAVNGRTSITLGELLSYTIDDVDLCVIL